MKYLILFSCLVFKSFGGILYDGSHGDMSTGSIVDSVLNQTNTITIAGWAIRQATIGVPLWSKRDPAANVILAQFRVNTAEENESMDFAYFNGGFNTYQSFVSSVNTKNKPWHVAVTYTYGNAGSMKVYINGSLLGGSWIVGSGTALAVSNGFPVSIGKVQNSTATWTYGLNEVSMWDKALSYSQIQFLSKSKLKLAPLFVERTNLMIYWPLIEQPEGKVLASTISNPYRDWSGHGIPLNNADVSGSPTARAENILSYFPNE